MDIIIIIGIIISAVMLIYFLKSPHPLRTAIKSMISGATALVLVYFFGELINIEVTLSLFNTGTSLLLGIPGVVLIVVSKFI